jgi:hypothetical protein
MKANLLVFFCLLVAQNSLAQSWNFINESFTSKVNLFVLSNPLNIYGEINPNDIGVNGPGVGLYGVQGGGLASAFVMLAAHAASVQGQRSNQLEKLNNDSLVFGKLLSDKLNGVKSDKFLNEVIASMPDVNFVTLSMINSKEEMPSGYFIDYRYSVTRDYYGLILDISFSDKNSGKFIHNSTIHQNKNSPYIGSNGVYDSPYDIRKDMAVLMEEAVRIFLNRDNLVKRKSASGVTFKSLSGKNKKYERGMLISETCDKHLFISLANTWISAPKLESNFKDVLCDTGLNDLKLN